MKCNQHKTVKKVSHHIEPTQIKGQSHFVHVHNITRNSHKSRLIRSRVCLCRNICIISCINKGHNIEITHRGRDEQYARVLNGVSVACTGNVASKFSSSYQQLFLLTHSLFFYLPHCTVCS